MSWKDKAIPFEAPTKADWRSKAVPVPNEDFRAPETPTEPLKPTVESFISPQMREGGFSYAQRVPDVAKDTLTKLSVPGTLVNKSDAIKRFGKQFYNVALAAPAHAIGTKSTIGKAGAELNALGSLENDFRQRVEQGQPVTEKEIEFYAKPYKSGTFGSMFGLERPDWAHKIWSDYQSGNIKVAEQTPEENIKRLNKALQEGKLNQSEQTDISVAVTQADSLTEKAVDIIAGVAGFTAQLVALKKAFPTAPPVVIWELQNQVTGGTTGKGALTYAAFTGPAKLFEKVKTTTPKGEFLSKIGQTATASVSLGGLTALEQAIENDEINWMDVAVSAGIPIALRTPELIKAGIKIKNFKIVKAAQEVIQKQPPITPLDHTIQTLKDWSTKAEKIKKEEWEPAVKKLRKEQATAGLERLRIAKSKGKSAEEAIRAAKKGFKKKAVRPEVKPPELSNEQWNSVSSKAMDVYGDDVFRLANTQRALDNLRFKGKIPTNYELGLLEPVLGTPAVEQIYNNLVQHRTYELWDIPRLLRDGLKSMFGYDPQVFRQLGGIKTRHPIIYTKAGYVNIRAYVSKNYADKVATQLENSPGWKIGQSDYKINFLGTKPWKTTEAQRLQQYGDFTDFLLSRKNRVAQAWGKWLRASERGANVGIDVGLAKLVDNSEKQLSRLKVKKGLTDAQVKAFRLNRGKDINAFTKRVVAKNPKAREIQSAANWVLFSPAYTISRPIGTWRAIKNIFAGGVGNHSYAAELTLSNIASITALGSISAWVGDKWRKENPLEEPKIDGSNNPLDSLWGKIRVGKDVIDPSSGDASWYRTLARIGVSSYLYGKQLAGTEQTMVAGKTPQPAGEEVLRYFQSRETVLLGLAKTLLTGKDWIGEPIPRTEALLKQIPFEALVSVVEAGNADGMWDALSQGDVGEASKDLISNLPIGAAGLMGLGTLTYPPSASSTRVKFREIMANREYQKDWNDLTKPEQLRLRIKYKDNFEQLNWNVKKEGLDRPYNPENIIEEKRKSHQDIKERLTKENQIKVEGISLAVDRSPENWFLNDERYAQYKTLFAKYLNERLSKTNLPEGMNTKVRTAILDSLIHSSKVRALSELKRKK